jgi:hypothetical protein
MAVEIFGEGGEYPHRIRIAVRGNRHVDLAAPISIPAALASSSGRSARHIPLRFRFLCCFLVSGMADLIGRGQRPECVYGYSSEGNQPRVAAGPLITAVRTCPGPRSLAGSHAPLRIGPTSRCLAFTRMPHPKCSLFAVPRRMADPVLLRGRAWNQQLARSLRGIGYRAETLA